MVAGPYLKLVVPYRPRFDEPAMRRSCASVQTASEAQQATERLACLQRLRDAIESVSEAFVLATKAGVNPEAVFNAIKGGLAGSTVMNAKVPMILDGNFKPGFRIELHIKDLQNALDTAHALNCPVPLTAGIMEIMQALKADEMATCDHSAVVRFYEKLAKVEVRK